MINHVQQVKYKVFFHQGEELGLKTRVLGGWAWLDNDALYIESTEDGLLQIPLASILSAHLFKLHGSCHVIQLELHKKKLFLSVIRFLIAGQFILVNLYKTRELHRRLRALIGHP